MAVRSVAGQLLVFEESGQCEKSENRRLATDLAVGACPRNIRKYNLSRSVNLRCEKAIRIVNIKGVRRLWGLTPQV